MNTKTEILFQDAARTCPNCFQESLPRPAANPCLGPSLSLMHSEAQGAIYSGLGKLRTNVSRNIPSSQAPGAHLLGREVALASEVPLGP